MKAVQIEREDVEPGKTEELTLSEIKGPRRQNPVLELVKDNPLVIKGRSQSASAPQEPEPDPSKPKWNPLKIAAALKNAFREISTQIVGREELLNQTLYALLTREHQLIYSRAGMAKSLYAEVVFSRFKGAQTFETQLTKGTTEEGIVGGINIQELKQGNVVHNVKGTIVDARLAFLDEIFDANDVTLRSLLGILNERKFRKGKQYVEAELHTAIATSNYVRQNDVTEAVVDRFAFRSVLLPDDSPYTMLLIDKVYAGNTGRCAKVPNSRKIPIEALDFLADVVEGQVPELKISAPAHILFLKNAIIQRYVEIVNAAREKEDKKPIYVSPRTIAKARDVLNASALLHGRTQVTPEDLHDLKYMIATIGGPDKEEEKFKLAVEQVTAELSKDDLKSVDFLMEVDELFRGIIEANEQGHNFEATFWDRVKLFFGITSVGQLTYGGLKRAVEKVNSENSSVMRLKSGVLDRITTEQARLDLGDSKPLL